MQSGGFSVAIGNPPYVASSKVRSDYTVKGYDTGACPDIYAWCLERVTDLVAPDSRVGMIIPLSVTFSGDFSTLRNLLLASFQEKWFSSFGRIPSALFNYDVRVRNTICLASRRGAGHAYSTRLHRWFDEERPHLFGLIEYACFEPARWDGLIPKVGSQGLCEALEALEPSGHPRVRDYCARSSETHRLFFKKTAYNWLAFSHIPPPAFDAGGKPIPQTQLDTLDARNATARRLLFLLLNGKIAFVYWYILGDDFHVTKGVIASLPAPSLEAISNGRDFQACEKALTQAMQEAVAFKLNAGKKVGNFNLARCRAVTDQTDIHFAHAMGLFSVWEAIETLYAKGVKTDFDDIGE